MNRDGSERLYVQMAPDGTSLAGLSAVVGGLASNTGRPMPVEELHLTLIHFGRTADIFTALREKLPLTQEEYHRQLAVYVAATEVLLNDMPYALVPDGYARFGHGGSTLVARYDAPPELVRIHDQAYRTLLAFLDACGVADPAAFARANPNLAHSRDFAPHVTLYKGYSGPDPDAPPPSIAVRFMKLVY